MTTVTIAGKEINIEAILAENVELKKSRDLYPNPISTLVDESVKPLETPATDAVISAIRAEGRIEGINFAASRLCAAFEHGFVDKPDSEVIDVVRMILSAKDEIKENPAPDGLSGEYAEAFLADRKAVL